MIDKEKLGLLETFLKETFETPDMAIKHLMFLICWIIDGTFQGDNTDEKDEAFDATMALMQTAWALMRKLDHFPEEELAKFVKVMEEGGIEDDSA